ncbi:hypothetical protein N657DRAFT_642886 [Parathielavia appendiculata]|uniref:Uncharacterized protein n=1 Tax=Parathielavia appendiculata TaxID=2587402 RepID=A0AAN6Z5T2_9PEZI|nr:hypothetical protein N657DRAFT_642886 [Parathielavia appendiculata]
MALFTSAPASRLPVGGLLSHLTQGPQRSLSWFFIHPSCGDSRIDSTLFGRLPVFCVQLHALRRTALPPEMRACD